MESIHVPEPAALDGALLDPTSVYRYYDRHGLLLYVGITRQGIGRNRQHNDKAEWWPFVVRQEVEHLPSRPAALAREKRLIQQHRPPFNRQHNLDHESLRLTYLHWASAEAPVEGERAEDQVARLARRLPLDLAECSATRLVLRSRIEHRPLASLIKLAGERLPVWLGDDDERVAHVERVEHYDAFALLVCDAPTRPLPAALRAHAVLSWRRNPKLPVAELRRVVLRSAERPAVG